MTTTLVHDFRPEDLGIDLDKARSIIYSYIVSQGHEDKAGCIEDACFYEGFRTAMEQVIWLFSGKGAETLLIHPNLALMPFDGVEVVDLLSVTFC